jgi:polyribonucleotide nucleotidyltransferase
MISALVADVKSPSLPDGHVVESIDLPGYAIGSIIGKGGSNIKALEADTGASVDIKRGEGADGGDACKVTGPKEAVAAAEEKIKAVREPQPVTGGPTAS